MSMPRWERPVPPPKTVPVHVVAFHPWGVVQPTRASLTLDDGTTYAGVPSPPQTHFQLPPRTQYGWGARLQIEAPDCAPFNDRIVLAPDLNVQLGPAWTPLPRLVPSKRVFQLETGERFYGIMASAFALFERYLTEGEDAIRPVLEQRQALGFNLQRVWTAYEVPLIGRMWPWEHDGYYDRLPTFCDLLATYGQYAYVTSLTGSWPAGFDLVEHVARVESALATRTNTLSDRRNEADHTANRQARDLTLRPAPAGLLWSEGSGQADVRPPEPFGPFYAFHPAHFEHQRKVGKQGWEVDHARPCVTDETLRIEHGNVPIYQIEDAFACGQMFGAAACFHSPAGKLATLYHGYELEAAQAMVRGSTRFDLEVVQDGQYVNLPPGDFLRVYEKRLGDRVERLEIRR